MLTALSGAAALMYGVSDFLSGYASRRLPSVVNVARNEVAGAALLLVLLPFLPFRLSLAGVSWAVLAGLAGTGASWLMFRLMAVQPLSVICPMIAVMAAAEPAAVAMCSGERLRFVSALGVAAGLLAVALLGMPGHSPTSGRPVSPRVLAWAAMVGAGFGAYFVLLARAGGANAGVGPALVAKLSSVALVWPIALIGRPRQVGGSGLWWLTSVAGCTDAVGDLSFSVAAGGIGLAISGVVAAMAPAATALLALVLLRERMGWRGGVGLGLSSVALGLLSS